MKPDTKIKIIGVFFSVAVVFAGYFLYPHFINGAGDQRDPIGRTGEVIKVDRNNDVNVKGESREEDSLEKGAANFASEILKYNEISQRVDPDAPVKKEGYGEYYVRAGSAVAIDAETGTILFDQNAKKRTAIASLTKIMTAVIVMEEIDNLEEEIVVIDEEVVSTIGTVIGCPRSGYCISNRLQIGERISARSLLEAALVNSTNDATVALGNHIAGSREGFAKMMNDKAEELGLTDTNFCNASGLDEEDNPGGCYSTAYDIARVAAYSLKYDTIWSIMQIKDKDIYSVDGRIKHRIVSTDLLLEQMSNCIGGKTGFTYEAGKSLMTAAHHPLNRENKVISVLINDNYRWEDMKKLMSWVFEAYEWPKNK